MRRRRRNKATWLPIVPTEFESALDQTWYSTTLTFPEGELTSGDTAVQAFPLTFDDSAEQETSATASLRDKVEGQDYTLDRIVGKVWMSNDYPGSSIYQAIGCIAFGVFPSDPTSGGIALDAEDYHPLVAHNAQQPWIWRRTWVLQQIQTEAAWTGWFPCSTAGYAGSLDGGHVDTRGSRRRVTKEHRLFIVAAASVITSVEPEPGQNIINWGYDLRLIGGMRRGRNTSSF